MDLIDLFDTGEVYDARPVSPPPTARRPYVNLQTAPTARIERVAFGVLSESGELPLLGIGRPRPDTTARIVISETAHPVELEAEPRPWFYRGAHRWTRSRALLTAATWPGGVR